MKGDLQKALGRNVRAHRQGLGISQEALAKQLDFHRSYIGALERGERNMSLQSIEDLAERLGMSPTDLLRE